ncbi:MAG TPA: DUF3800 domain-containing protein [Dehalococcoidia bacterium]|nr:DUF3800 domain-containing protein [Dehalococcoidia bacterium]
MRLADIIRERFIVSLVCYVDESGSHDKTGTQPGSDVVGVAGWLGWKDKWDTYEREWQAKLKAYGVKVFHYADFNASHRTDDPTWIYYKWSGKKRERFIQDLIPIARDNTILGIGAYVNVQDYNRLTPDWLKAYAQHPFYFCFKFFFDCVLTDIESTIEGPYPEGEQIAFVFDRQLQFKSRALEMFEWAKEQDDIHGRLGTITLDADKEKYPPLQAADLLAVRMRKVTSRITVGNQAPITAGGWDDQLGGRKNVSVRYFYGEELQGVIDNTVALHREAGLDLG